MIPTADDPRPEAEAPGDDGAPAAKGIAARVVSSSRQRVEPPASRGLVLGLIAAAALVAAVLQFTVFQDSSPGGGIRKSVEESNRPPPRAPLGPGERVPAAPPLPAAPPGSPQASAPGPSPVAVVEDGLPPAPGASIEVPAGLSPRTAGRLRLDLSGLAQARLIAESAVRDLPDLVAECPPEDRLLLRPFVAGRLAELAADPRLGACALDAALRLASTDVAGLEAVVRAACQVGVGEDATAVPALLLLETVPPEGREPCVAAVVRVVEDPARALHVRVLAARTLAAWGAAAEARAHLAGRPDTPRVLSEALTGTR